MGCLQMDQEEILENYLKFRIPTELIPAYNSPVEFAAHFKKCGITTDLTDITYSKSTQI